MIDLLDTIDKYRRLNAKNSDVCFETRSFFRAPSSARGPVQTFSTRIQLLYFVSRHPVSEIRICSPKHGTVDPVECEPKQINFYTRPNITYYIQTDRNNNTGKKNTIEEFGYAN